MLHTATFQRNGVSVTLDEHKAILRERLEVLSYASAWALWGQPLPAGDRVGWRCSWTPLARSRDGSLLVELRCTGPALSRAYVRRVRLVRRADLTSRLG